MWLTADAANLKLVVAVVSPVLVLGTLVLNSRLNSDELLAAILLVSYLVFCSYLSNYRFSLACYLLAIPLLVMAAMAAVYVAVPLIWIDEPVDPRGVLWFSTTAIVGLYSSFALRNHRRVVREEFSPTDRAGHQ